MTFQTLKEQYPFVTETQFLQLEKLVNLFVEKNKQINLSAFKDEESVWIKHVYDSLSTVDIIEKIEPQSLLDMGTGGGFPTLPLAIILPEIRFFPLDSVQKKLKCVREFSDSLGLKNISILSGRAEELAYKKPHREQYDIVVTRAFANFSPMLEMTMPFVKEKGYLLAYLGPENDEQENDLLLDHFGGFCEDKFFYILPSGEKREIWKIKKVEPTMKHLPRRTGTPKKEPVSFIESP